jgi:hypothetical protein
MEPAEGETPAGCGETAIEFLLYDLEERVSGGGGGILLLRCDSVGGVGGSDFIIWGFDELDVGCIMVNCSMPGQSAVSMEDALG